MRPSLTRGVGFLLVQALPYLGLFSCCVQLHCLQIHMLSACQMPGQALLVPMLMLGSCFACAHAHAQALIVLVLMPKSCFAHALLSSCSCLSHALLMLCSDHAQLMLNSCSAHAQVMLSSRSGHAFLTLCSGCAQLMLCSQDICADGDELNCSSQSPGALFIYFAERSCTRLTFAVQL